MPPPRVGPFIQMAWQRPLEERDAHSMLPDEHDTLVLAAAFERVYESLGPGGGAACAVGIPRVIPPRTGGNA